MKTKLLIIFSCCLLLPVFLCATEYGIPVGEQFRDTSGNPLQAHGGGIWEYNGYYYWFGENRSGDILVSCYRSTDFKNWEFRNHVLLHSSNSELGDANIERPKVIYNPQTGRFVMWAHKELSSDYSQARAAVAVSNTIDGNYTWQRSFRPLNYMSRDCTLFVDDDGRAYFISAANENYDLHIYRLTSDFLDIESLVYIFDGYHREAPALFKHNGIYFLITSGATGWDPNQAQYSTASSLSGSWSAWQNIGNSTTYDSQSTYIQPIRGSQMTSYLYMGDRWAGAWGGAVNDSQYVWMPVNINSSTSISLSFSSDITIDTETGLVMNGAAVNENNRLVIYLDDITEGTARNQFEYVGSWSYGSESSAYEGDNHWNGDTDEYYMVRFYGIQIEVYGARAPGHGIAAMSVDGSGETMVDYYAGSRSDQVLMYTSPVLSAGNHTLKVRVTGNQNANADGVVVNADMVKIIVSDSSSTTSVPSGTLGDVNGDKQVDIIDALMTAQYYVGLNPQGFNQNFADVNRDGQIDIIDALRIARYYVGLISGF